MYMITPDLVQYVQKNLAEGKSRDQIQRDLLIAGGWKADDIQEAFAAIDGRSAPAGSASKRSGSGFVTFFIVLVLLGGIAYGAEKFYGPAISAKLASVSALNPFKKTATDPAVIQANDALLNQAPNQGIPIASTSTADVAAPAVVATAAPLTSGTCADNDMSCIIKAAATCASASVKNADSVDLSGFKITATSLYGVSAPDTGTGCVFTINTQSLAIAAPSGQSVDPAVQAQYSALAGKQGACTFAKASSVVTLLKKLQARTFNPESDFASGTCTGTFFSDSL